jgi:hypothetical protein
MELGWEQRQFGHLEIPFSKYEIMTMVKQTSKDKAPDPEGFIGGFFSACWDIIKGDLIRAIHQFYLMNHQNLNMLNQAHVVLILKKEVPQSRANYIPLSLTHSFTKIISKMLSNRLGSALHQIISYNQIAFIKSRCIHNNFVHV